MDNRLFFSVTQKNKDSIGDVISKIIKSNGSIQEISDCIESGSEFNTVVGNCSSSVNISASENHLLLNGENVVPCENNNSWNSLGLSRSCLV